MMSRMVTPIRRIKIDPIFIVSRNPHLCRITMVQIRSALIIFGSVIIMRIVHIRIVIEPLPILRIGCRPLLSISLLCRRGVRKQEQAKRAENGKRNRAEHNFNPFGCNPFGNEVNGTVVPCPISALPATHLKKMPLPVLIGRECR